MTDLVNYFKDMNEEKIVHILIAIIIVTATYIVSSLISYIIIKVFMVKEKDKDKIKSNAFYLPLRALIIVLGMYAAVIVMALPKSVMARWKQAFDISLICIVSKALVNVVDPKSDIAKKFRKKDASNKEITVASFTGRILKYIIYILDVFLILHELGYGNISNLITGLGISGAIVALAAQDIVKSLLSGMSILADKPFLVGDWVEIGTNQGTVQDISFRCTKIKTVNNTVITFPNSTITANAVINWSRLKQRRYELNLKLPLETNYDVIETVINRIKFVLQSNEKVVPKTVEVNFDTIDKEGFNINIYLYTKCVDYEKFLAFKQEINGQILGVLESEEVKLAYPGQNIYVMKSEESITCKKE